MWIFAILCLIKIFKCEVIVIEETCIDLNRNQPIRRIQNKGNIAELNGVVSSQEECEFLLTIINKNTSIRIESKVELHQGKYLPSVPAVFVVRTDTSVKNWRIPVYNPINSLQYASTLCQTFHDNETMKITVSSRSETDIRFSLKISALEDDKSFLQPGKTIESEVSPTTQQLFHFSFDEHNNKKKYLLKVQGNDEYCPVCTLVSVQPEENCKTEIFDKEQNMRYGNKTIFQTMLDLSAITIMRDDYQNGICVVLLSKSSEEDCHKDTNKSDQSKCMSRLHTKKDFKVNVTIEELETEWRDPLTSTLIVIGFYIVSGLFAVISSCVASRRGIELVGKLGKYEIRLKDKVDKERSLRKDFSRSFSIANSVAKFKKSNTDSDYESAKSQISKDSNLSSIPYIDASDDPDKIQVETAVVELGTSTSTTSTTDEVDNGPTPIRNGVDKKRVGNSKPAKLFYQERIETEDELDDAEFRTKSVNRVIYDNCIRSRHSSEVDRTDSGSEGNYVTRVIQLNTEKIKRKRNDRVNVTVADMSFYHNSDYFPNTLKLRSDLFVWLIFLAGIFYTLPVFQLVYYYQETSLRTGDLDTCYYNFLCQYPYGPFWDYNHVFSNIGYIICGISFMCIVKYRSHKNKELVEHFGMQELGPKHPKFTGIPESSGIFYAMGAALMFEGILSACYHICPTANNFQFDTTFMYCISVLVFLKVYQFRHSDVTQMAHIVFFIIGVALMFEVLGIFTDSIFFWIIFVLVYVIFIFIFIVQIYYGLTFAPGPYKCLKVMVEITISLLMCKKDACKKVMLPGKLVSTIFVLLVNALMAVFFASKRKPGVSRYILSIMMVNMILYVSFYIGHKLYFRWRKKDWRPSEGIRPIAWTYILLSILCMLLAVYFFKKELKSSAKSPAESRNINAPCAVLIFDNHDLWHFLSAGGLFYLFMFILTLEDYNRAQPRTKIPVF